MKSYLDLLKSPKWYHKRRNIILRDGNKCTVCGRNILLIVHHTFYYEDFPDPWLYPDYSLLTLCNKCHKDWHEYNEIVIKKRPVVKCKVRIKKKVIKEKKNMTLKQLYKIWEPKMRGKGFRFYNRFLK